MAVKTQTFHIAVCNVCGAEFDETGDYRYWDDSPELALAQVRYEPDSNWVLLADDTIICPTGDSSHYLARGGDSPLALAPSTDAMAVAFEGAA